MLSFTGRANLTEQIPFYGMSFEVEASTASGGGRTPPQFTDLQIAKRPDAASIPLTSLTFTGPAPAKQRFN